MISGFRAIPELPVYTCASMGKALNSMHFDRNKNAFMHFHETTMEFHVLRRYLQILHHRFNVLQQTTAPRFASVSTDTMF